MKNIPLQGAVDLAALAKPKSTTPEKASSPFIVEVTDQNFEELITEISTRVPVVLDLWAEWCQPCKQLSPVLEKLAIEGNGSWVLAKVDVDANPGIAQTFKPQSIPAVYLIMAKQAQPLFQGVYPESDLRKVIAKVLEMATQLNLPGLGIPIGQQSEVAEESDPAEELMLAGDLAGAAEIYRSRLTSNPNDANAKAGLALIALQERSVNLALTNLESSVASDIEARMQFADGQILQGNAQLAYDSLIESIRSTSGKERELVKNRLLELFDLADPADPIVLAARRQLASALY